MFHLDEESLERLVKKDESTFHIFYNNSVKIFFRYIKSKAYISEAQTQDLVSELYVKIWNNLPNYKKDHSFETRCWTILRNMMTDNFRKTKEESLSEYESSEHYFEDDIISKIAELVAIIQDQSKSEDERFEARLKLQQLPRNANPTRLRSRCQLTGRPRGTFRQFGLGRMKLRDAAMAGEVPGLVKASW